MTALTYNLAAWRRYREEHERPARETHAELTLADIPADAEMDEGIVLGCWNGERFVSWEKWLATVPIEHDPQPKVPAIPSDARCVKATCGATRVWLVRDGERWLMFAGTQKCRRRDFASPCLEHAMRTAEAWYGQAAGGWQAGH